MASRTLNTILSLQDNASQRLVRVSRNFGSLSREAQSASLSAQRSLNNLGKGIEKTVTNAVKKVGQIGEVVEVENTLETWNDIVGGWIQTFPLASDMLIICNEEGKLKGLEPNVEIVVGECSELIVGDFAIVKQGYDDFEGLDDEQIERLRKCGLVK